MVGVAQAYALGRREVRALLLTVTGLPTRGANLPRLCLVGRRGERLARLGHLRHRGRLPVCVDTSSLD